MCIRIEIPTPFRFVIEEGASYPPIVVEHGPHNVTVLPPIAGPIVQTDRALSPLRGKKSFQADTLVVEMKGDVPYKNLRGNNLEPLVEKAFKWANWFLMRYRDYKQAYFIQPVVRWQMSYAINYYPVKESATATVQREQYIHKILSTYLLPETWEGIATLDRSYETPPWIHLLLDARFAAHPGVGLVLAWAALEMVIDHTLEELAKRSQVHSGLWKWLTTTRNKQPTTEEQYTKLLEVLGGRSLNKEARLWKNFLDIRELRNQFAHGRELEKLELNKKPVPKQRIGVLIHSARDIVAFVNKQLPPQSQWRMFPEYTGPYGGFAGLSVGPEEAA